MDEFLDTDVRDSILIQKNTTMSNRVLMGSIFSGEDRARGWNSNSIDRKDEEEMYMNVGTSKVKSSVW